MNKNSFFAVFFLLLGYCGLEAQIVNIPDANFKNALVNTDCVDTTGDAIGDMDADINDNGEIEVSEALAVNFIYIEGNSIQSLEGIESFINIQILDCRDNQLTALDLQSLNNLQIMDCSYNQLISLNIQGLSNLEALSCGANKLTGLNLQDLGNLQQLDCASNQITSLNLQSLSNLQSLQLSFNKLTTLNVLGLNNLKDLDCGYNQLTSLNVHDLTNLKELGCQYNQLTNLNIQNLSSLQHLYCGSNQLTTLNVQGLSNLQQLLCFNNQITSLNLQDLSNLNNLQCEGNQLLSLFIKNGSIESSLGFSYNPNLSYICCDLAQLTDVYNKTLLYGLSNCLVNSACSNINTTLNGSIIDDQNLNCEKDPNEIGLEKRIIKAKKQGEEPLYAISNNEGQYLMGLDTGLYKISTYLLNNYSLPCEDSVWVNLPNLNDSATVDIPLQTVVSCPLLEVNIASNLMRRCFNNQYIVQYCNSGTVAAPNAQVTVTLSDDVTYVSSSIVGINVGGNDWQFSVGAVQPDDCGSFSIVFYVNCDSTVIGQSICATAHVTPDSICTPAGSPWSGAQVMVDGFCEGDSVRFSIQNIGFGDMTQDQDFVVIEDDVILRQGSFNLASQAAIVIKTPANGSSWRMEAGQEPTFPFVSMPFANVEGCGLNLGGLFSLGFVTQFSEQDGNPFFSRECREITGSYDPNEKSAQPKGVYDAHYIYPNTEIEYQINFQNTGTDTAFAVAIKDTLPQGLDVSTFRAGIASHLYEVALSEHGILTFTFDQIFLPDSNVNEAASHGFVRYRILPKNTIALGTRIENRAGIYFDFNEPVITNTVFHTVDTGFLERNIVQVFAPSNAERMRIAPNPVHAGQTIFFDISLEKEHHFVLTNTLGMRVFERDFIGNRLIVPSFLNGGVYFFEMRDEVGKRFVGTLVVD
jgi:uncharacterized repeat protein (TIGR01451 family)